MNEQLLAELNAAAEFFERSTRNLTEDDSTYVPVDGIFTAAQQIGHAAQTIDWFMDGAFRPGSFDLDFEAHERAVRGVSSVADARAWFTRAVENARSVINTTPDEEWVRPICRGAGHGWRTADGHSRRHHRSHRPPSWRAVGLIRFGGRFGYAG